MEELASLPLAGNTKVLCYADDIAIVSTGPHYHKRAQEAITAVTSICQSLGLKVNFAKTKAVYFNGKRTQLLLRTHQTNIEWSP